MANADGAAAGARGLTTHGASQGVEGRPLTPEKLLDALLDPISGPLVDESTNHFDLIGAMLRRPDVMAFIDRQLAAADAAREALRVERDGLQAVVEQVQKDLFSERDRRVAAQEAIVTTWQPKQAELAAEVARLRAQLEQIAMCVVAWEGEKSENELEAADAKSAATAAFALERASKLEDCIEVLRAALSGEEPHSKNGVGKDGQ